MKIRRVEKVVAQKDLGVIVTETLLLEKQCAEGARKADALLGMIRRLFEDLDASSFRILYKSYVRPHLEYCVQAWSPYLRKDKSMLEKVQRRVTRLMKWSKRLSHEDRIKCL